MQMSSRELNRFIIESNAIEGITRMPLQDEIDAHTALLDAGRITLETIQDFIYAIAGQGARLRVSPKDCVRVGNHIPPAGGQHIAYSLQNMLDALNADPASIRPYEFHCAYLTLHPFMDGNGRSARAIYAWHSDRLAYSGYIMRGFLHQVYYDGLNAYDGRAANTKGATNG